MSINSHRTRNLLPILFAGSTWIWWLAAGDLVKSLLEGNPAEILLGLYVVVPVALAVLFSTIGLGFELFVKPSAARTQKEDV